MICLGLTLQMADTIVRPILAMQHEYNIVEYSFLTARGEIRLCNQVFTVRNITYKEKSLIEPLFKAIVRPHLEYCIHAWSPYLRKDIDMLDKIQRIATKLIPGLRDLRYEERRKAKM